MLTLEMVSNVLIFISTHYSHYRPTHESQVLLPTSHSKSRLSLANNAFANNVNQALQNNVFEPRNKSLITLIGYGHPNSKLWKPPLRTNCVSKMVPCPNVKRNLDHQAKVTTGSWCVVPVVIGRLTQSVSWIAQK